jgi:hypothetical protein
VRENVKDKEEATMKVSDLSIDEFKELIGKVIEEKIRELVDPDYGLELREDFVHALENSIASKERISFEEVKKKIWIKLIECLIWSNFTPQAEKDLARLDKIVAQSIAKKIDWLAHNIENIIPIPLKGKFKDKYKLRSKEIIDNSDVKDFLNRVIRKFLIKT